MIENNMDKNGKMLAETHYSRTALELKMIPEFLYEKGMVFLRGLATGSNILNTVFMDILDIDGVDNPYGPDPISVEPFMMGENRYVVCINFPEPEDEELCYKGYAIIDVEQKKMAYYCLQKGGEGEDPSFCEVDKDGNVTNLGKCANDNTEIINMILKAF